MNADLRTVVAVVLISLGGAMLGRALSRWARRRLTGTQLFAGLLSGLAAVGIGVTYRMNRVTDPNAQWIELGCIVVFSVGILIDSHSRTSPSTPLGQ